MSFISLKFLLFLLIALLFYHFLPQRLSNYALLIISYGYYALYSWKALLILIIYTMIIWLISCGMLKNRLFLFPGLICSLLPLVVFKYIHPFDIVAPLGISYFTFKSIGYLVDLYRNKKVFERDIFTLAVFISFFPEMLVGPIDRSDNLLRQLKRKKKNITWKNLEEGMLLFGTAFFVKLVIADRIGVIVDNVYSNLDNYSGLVVLVAILLYSTQIYLDFASCSTMAVGIGKMFGYELPVNFNQPYLALSVSDFWRRWHISLTSWLKDYIYIPLGGNRKGIIRKYINVLIVFAVSGIWHGAGFHFFLWGMINGALQVIETAGRKFMPKTVVFQRIYVYLTMSFAWIFFRADSLKQAGQVITRLFSSWNPWVLTDDTFLNMGLNGKEIAILIFALVMVAIIDIYHEKKVAFTEFILSQNVVIKACFWYVLIFSIIIFGVYGNSFNAGNFIYMNF